MFKFLKQAVAQKEILEQSTHFLFSDDVVYACDGIMILGMKNEYFSTEEDFSIPAKELLSILQKAGKDCTITNHENKIKIQNKKFIVTLNKHTGRMVNAIKTVLPKNDWVYDDCTDGLFLCADAALLGTQDINSACLVWIYKDYAVGFSPFRVTVFKQKFKVGPSTVLIPRALKVLKKSPMVAYQDSEKMFHFLLENKAWLAVYKENIGFRFDTKKFDKLKWMESFVTEEELISSMKKVNVIKSEDNMITMKIRNDRIILQNENRLIGKSSLSVDANTGTNIDIKVFPNSFRNLMLKDCSISVDSSKTVMKIEHGEFVHYLPIKGE